MVSVLKEFMNLLSLLLLPTNHYFFIDIKKGQIDTNSKKGTIL